MWGQEDKSKDVFVLEFSLVWLPDKYSCISGAKITRFAASHSQKKKTSDLHSYLNLLFRRIAFLLALTDNNCKLLSVLCFYFCWQSFSLLSMNYIFPQHSFNLGYFCVCLWPVVSNHSDKVVQRCLSGYVSRSDYKQTLLIRQGYDLRATNEYLHQESLRQSDAETRRKRGKTNKNLQRCGGGAVWGVWGKKGDKAQAALGVA